MTADPATTEHDESGHRPGSNPRARTRLYRDGAFVLRDFPVADIAGHLSDPTSVVWLDLCRPTAADFAMVDAQFGLHELAIEDAVQQSQRPKLDHYPTHLFLSAYAVTLDADATRVNTGEIAAFITDQTLITVRHDDRFDITAVLARWDAAPELARHWAAIIAVPTAITGFYGQNLPYPGSGTDWGVLLSTGLVAAMSTALYVAFKRKDWL
jgi:magnesium transporter